MKNITKKLLVASAVAALTLPLVGLAVDKPIDPGSDTYDSNRVVAILGNIADVLFAVLVAISVFFILRSAWLYVQGDKIDDAKKGLLYAGVGLAIGLLAKVLPQLVFGLLRGVVNQ